ncbi:predicted protein [Histoplasma capsulatum var. duboisii H88]|uniref:Predicted protein n=1 Tax=Ajellomyces capsulatus (strain H88) TaxID=544711 RepID=F0UGB1_AJEC8|nr:predicted protein [Histoplasma capsulatum var. duboisii H88]
MSSTWLHGSTPSGQSGGLVRKEGSQIDFICSGTEVGADFPKLTITIHRESNPGLPKTSTFLGNSSLCSTLYIQNSGCCGLMQESRSPQKNGFMCVGDPFDEWVSAGYELSIPLIPSSNSLNYLQANPGLFIYTWQRRMAKTSIEWEYSQSLVNRIAHEGTTTKPWAQENLRDFNLFIQKEMDEKKYLYTG